MVSFRTNPERMTMGQKLIALNWGLLLLIICLACVGFSALYSAAGGNWYPWTFNSIVRFVPILFFALVIALIDVKYWFMMAWPIWIAGLLLLVVVQIFGHTGMGAQRWINLGVMKLQPSELMKIAVIMLLARYYHLSPKPRNMKDSILSLGGALFIIMVPALLVGIQPDLGTALMVIMGGVAIIFLAGVSIWYFALGASAVALAAPLFWLYGIKDYQKERVLTFLNPDRDPLGAGYHITQSKIAIGSGGFWGKGFNQGTQSRLNFLPEKHTDFIFTHFAEEWGFAGGLALLGLLILICGYGYYIAFNSRHKFGYLLALGLMINFFLYIFINIGMVMGLIPVVGAPLPLVSYGGTSMLAVMISFGLMMSVWIHRERTMPRTEMD